MEGEGGVVVSDLLPGGGNTDPFRSSLGHTLSFVHPLMSYWKNLTRGKLQYVPGGDSHTLRQPCDLADQSLGLESSCRWQQCDREGWKCTPSEEGVTCLTL